jgi:hypothetical protein
MATRRPRHDTLREHADKLPNKTDETGQLESAEPRGFPEGADPLEGYDVEPTRPANGTPGKTKDK